MNNKIGLFYFKKAGAIHFLNNTVRMHTSRWVWITLLLVGKIPLLYSQALYSNALSHLKDMMSGIQSLSFKAAVFEVENVYQEGKLQRNVFQKKLTLLIELSKLNEQMYPLQYSGADKKNVQKWASIFKSMTDTLSIRSHKDSVEYQLLPFRYNFEDIWGAKHWENMFVTQLLDTRKGNCHSMPYLYKILCEELGVPCPLALAPNHIYVKHQSEKAGWYNTELNSASFPIDAWLMASGYITLEAIQNGIYMDALDDKQCIALCVLDLAKGFDRKYPQNDGQFIVQSCDLTLAYFPKCINAMLLKAETRKKQLEQLMKTLPDISIATVRLHPQGKIWWKEINQLYTQIHRLGYRTMPERMYIDWLISLQKEREKYSNKPVMNINKK